MRRPLPLLLLAALLLGCCLPLAAAGAPAPRRPANAVLAARLSDLKVKTAGEATVVAESRTSVLTALKALPAVQRAHLDEGAVGAVVGGARVAITEAQADLRTPVNLSGASARKELDAAILHISLDHAVLKASASDLAKVLGAIHRLATGQS